MFYLPHKKDICSEHKERHGIQRGFSKEAFLCISLTDKVLNDIKSHKSNVNYTDEILLGNNPEDTIRLHHHQLPFTMSIFN